MVKENKPVLRDVVDAINAKYGIEASVSSNDIFDFES